VVVNHISEALEEDSTHYDADHEDMSTVESGVLMTRVLPFLVENSGGSVDDLLVSLMVWDGKGGVNSHRNRR